MAKKSTVSIKGLPSGTLECSPAEIVPKAFGSKFREKTIILEYEVPSHNIRAHHPIKVASATGDDDTSTAKQLQQEHSLWLGDVCTEQLAGLVTRLRTQCALHAS